MARASAGHYVVGIEGLALLRCWLTDREQADRRIAELATLVGATDQFPFTLDLDVPRMDVEAGYARWASVYDAGPNPLIHAEQPVVRALIDEISPAVALDAACGTGRHTRYLHAGGHQVIGIDTSDEMLARARAQLPWADLRRGDLTALPLEDRSVDLVICALALSHCPTLAQPIHELARVLRPGGRMILSDLHPALVVIGGTGFFIDAQGGAGNVTTYYHGHGEYFSAFASAGLEVESCIEPAIDEAGVEMNSGGLMGVSPEAFRTAYLGVPAALVWKLRRRVRRAMTPAFAAGERSLISP